MLFTGIFCMYATLYVFHLTLSISQSSCLSLALMEMILEHTNEKCVSTRNWSSENSPEIFDDALNSPLIQILFGVLFCSVLNGWLSHSLEKCWRSLFIRVWKKKCKQNMCIALFNSEYPASSKK